MDFNFYTGDQYFNGGTSTTWADWIKPLLTLISGILLKHLYDLYLSGQDRKSIASTFESDLLLLKEGIVRQYEEIMQKVRSPAFYDESPGIVFFKNEFNDIRSVDRNKLIKHYSRKSRKGKNAAKYVSKVRKRVDVLEIEVLRFKEGAEHFMRETNEFLQEYAESLDALRREIAMYAEGGNIEQFSKDKLASAFADLNLRYIHGKPLTTQYVVGLKETFHKELFQAPFDKNTSPLYESIFKFNSNARNLIRSIEGRAHRYKSLLQIVTASIRNVSLELFDHDLPIE